MEETRTQGRARALAMIMTSLMIGITLNAVCSNFSYQRFIGVASLT